MVSVAAAGACISEFFRLRCLRHTIFHYINTFLTSTCDSMIPKKVCFKSKFGFMIHKHKMSFKFLAQAVPT